MDIVAVVPMKLNSQRLPQKNTRPFRNGKPLCSYIFTTLLGVEEISRVCAYCSRPDIKKFLPNGVEFIRRSKDLDRDTTKMNEVLGRFASDIEADVYVMTHATAPFIKAESIKRGIRAVAENGYDSSFAARKVQDFVWKEGKPLNYSLDDIPRTQDIEPLYIESSGFYIYRREVIRDSGRRIGDNPFIVEVDEIEGIDIDEKIDFDIADAVYNQILREKA